MNLKKLREELDRLEAEAGTENILVKLWIHLPDGGSTGLDIGHIDLVDYRDPGEVNYVIWVSTPRREDT